MTLPADLTLTGLGSIVDKVIQDLQNAGTTLEGNGSIVIGSAASQLSALLNQLKSMIGENFTQPLNNLTREVRNTATQLYSATLRFSDMLNNAEACLLINAQVFLAGVQTVTSGLKSNIPFIADDAPRIDYFQFTGHSPSLVPKEGGQVIVHGFDLWEDNNVPPEVTLYAEDRTTVIKQVTPAKGQDIHSFVFSLDADFIKAHQGQNLQLQVIPREQRWIHWFTPRILGKFFMPMVMPKLAFSKFQVKAYLQYNVGQQVEEILDYRRFGMGNSSCEDRKTYAHTEVWPMPPGAIITSYVTKDPDVVNQSNVGISFAGNSITATGWLDTATCVGGFLGINHLLHDTHWWISIAPKILYTTQAPKSSNATSDFQEFQNNRVEIHIPLPKDAAGTDDVCWFELVLDNGDTQKTIYTSPHNNTANFPAADAGGLEIDAVYNSTVITATGTAELVVTVVLRNCGF